MWSVVVVPRQAFPVFESQTKKKRELRTGGFTGCIKGERCQLRFCRRWRYRKWLLGGSLVPSGPAA